jgi:hypothetical protein
MVGWFEALDDWGENVALTRSRHLIDGSLSLDGFRSGWMAAIAALGCDSRRRVQETFSAGGSEGSPLSDGMRQASAGAAGVAIGR